MSKEIVEHCRRIWHQSKKPKVRGDWIEETSRARPFQGQMAKPKEVESKLVEMNE